MNIGVIYMVTIRIFTTPTCLWCKKAKDYLKKRKLSYIELDVYEDNKARQEMITKTGQMGVPVIEIDGKCIVGFDQEQIEGLLVDAPEEKTVTVAKKVVVKKKVKKPVQKKWKEVEGKQRWKK
jgi:glutaredoxin-like YruB-family protein